MKFIFGTAGCKGKKLVSLLLAALVLLSVFAVVFTTFGTLRAQAADNEYLYIPVSMYDYKYDNQISNPGAAPDAGTRSGGFPNKTPYTNLNAAISASGYDVPLYFGDLFPDNGWGNTPAGLQNFYWGANIANQGYTTAAAQKLVDNTLTDGKLTQNGKELPYFSSDWFYANRSAGTSAVNSVSFEFYSNGRWWQDNADQTQRGFAQGNTYMYTVSNNQSRTFTQTVKGTPDSNTTFIINLDAANGWADKPTKVRMHITSATNQSFTVEQSVVLNGTQRRATYVLANAPAYATTGESYADIYENVQFPFYQTETDGVRYYEFDSAEKNLYFNGNTFAYTNNTVYDTALGNSKRGFFPFNNGDPADKGKLNYGFGAKFEIPFSMTSNGKIDGQDIVFQFTGDDDVWIFIDGKLVLDMGGAHAKSSGEINFNTKLATITTGAFNGKTTNQAASVTATSVTNFASLIDFSNPTETHTLTMFYMERGMWESNMKLRFNFPQTNTFTIDNRTSFDNVNSALLTDTIKEADNDVAGYDLQNQGSTQTGSSGYRPSAYGMVRTVEGQKTQLNVDTGVSPPVTTDNAIFLNAKAVNWSTPYVWAWKTGYAGSDYKMSYDSDAGYYYYNFSSKPENVIFKSGAGWGGVTQTGDLSPGGNNLFTLNASGTGGAWSLYDTGGTGGGTGGAYEFVPNGSNWTTVGGNVLYDLYDSYAAPKSMVGSGQNLFFGQTLTYVSQFTKNSYFSLTQRNTLQRPTREQGEAVIFNDSHKTLSDYYDTVWVLSDVDENVLGVGEGNTPVTDNLLAGSVANIFKYSNLDASDIVRSTVQRVVFQNTVKTGDIHIKKELTQEAAALGENEMFSFKLQLSNIFGSLDATSKTYPVQYTVDGTAYTAGNDGVIKLKAGQTATVSGVPVGTVYKISEINIPDGFQVASAGGDSTKTLLTGTVAQSGLTAAQGTFINDLSNAQITIEKTINELYYGASDNPAGLAPEVDVAQTNIPGDTHGYESYTSAEQSFVFKVEQFNNSACTGTPNKTSYVVISFDKTDGENLTKSETLNVEPGKYYKITEDTSLAWKYGLFAIAVRGDTTGNSYKDSTAAYLFASPANPVAAFTNNKSTAKNNIEGDTAVVINKLSPKP